MRHFAERCRTVQRQFPRKSRDLMPAVLAPPVYPYATLISVIAGRPTMQLRKPLVFLAVALAASLLICRTWAPVPYNEQLIRLQVLDKLMWLDTSVLAEPIAIQGQLLDYAHDKTLLMKAWIAIAKYPTMTREVLADYGSEPEFQEILRRYGESVIPVIVYFRQNDLTSLRVAVATGNAVQNLTGLAKELWARVTGSASPDAVAPAPELDPMRRGWMAVNFIRQEGHDLLGQFVVTPDLKIKRNQTDRFLKALTAFFSSGIRDLETKSDLGAEISKADYFWAGLDIAVIALPARLLRAGKLASRSGGEVSLATRTRIFAPRLVQNARMFKELGKYGAFAATIYVVVTHPSLINSLFAELAEFAGLNPLLVQFAGWAILITLLLYPVSWLLLPLARMVYTAMSWLAAARRPAH